MSCRACSGELGPPVGTRLNTDAGFTATCVQTAEVVRCDDTETDPRVDGSICIELGIRSILAVPVFDAQNVAGVLEVLSNEPKRFTDRHATALQLLARLVETLFNYVSGRDNSLDSLTANPKPQSSDSGKENADQAKVTCLSCGHSNPQGSQFCNRCGVTQFNSPGSLDTTVALSPAEATDSGAEEGFKEIYKLISGSGGLATWNDIYARLVANLHDTPQEKPPTATIEEPIRKDDTVMGFGRPQGATALKARQGRNLWL